MVDPPPSPRRRRARALLVVVATLVALVAVPFAGAAWYYAGEIHEGALEVRPPRAAAPDAVVESSSDGRVVLRESGAASDDDLLRSSGTHGLVWDGGAGVVSGEPRARDDGAVVRSFELVDGDPPAPGAEVDLRAAVWTDPAAAHGVTYREVDIPCGGGSCPAWFVPGEGATWMVFVHGKGASRSEPLRALGPAVEAGLPSLVITYRNDPGAPSAPSDSYRYGVTEWRDLAAAVEYALGHGAEDVVLFGASTGGAIVAGFLERSELADEVSGVVLDAPALDLDTIVEYRAEQRDLPVVGSVPDVVTEAAQWVAGWRYDLDWDRVDYLPADWLEVPALVFHGTADTTVPITVTDELAEGRPALVEAVRVPGAGHVRAWNAEPAAYERELTEFLDCVIAEPAPRTCASA